MDDNSPRAEITGNDQSRGESALIGAGSPAAMLTEADRRKMRQAQKLRENLQRRKQQLRSRRAGNEDETEGLPGASSGTDGAANSAQTGD